ncbi:MAG: response regulator transcription factor [Bacteroidia bacterium]|jgi:two-component system OmpR family response regulator
MKNKFGNRILLVEDENQLRENITELLEIQGFEVLAVDSGDKAISFLPHFKPSVILCDIRMPRYDGFWVLMETRKNKTYGHVPFIFISAKADRSEVRTGMDLGADDYLTKPFSSEELLGAVRARLERANEQQSSLMNTFNDDHRAKPEDFRALTPTEKKVLHFVALNDTSAAIAEKLGVSTKTVDNHRANISTKLKIKGNLSLLRYCLNNKKIIIEQKWVK